MESLTRDLRVGLRALAKSPGFAVVSTLTLAVAIGVNTAIFSLVSVIVFADLPMQESDTVHLVRSTNAALDIERGSLSPADYMDLEARARSFESMAALTDSQWILTGVDEPIRVSGLQFTVGLSESWQLPPILGRAFVAGEDRYGAAPVAMLTHGFWQERYASRTDVVGETIKLNDIERTIVGVTHPKLEFASFARAQVVTPLILNRGEPNRTARYLFVSGRLAAGVTHEMALAEVRQIGTDLAAEYSEHNRGWGLVSTPVMEGLIDEDGNTILLLLQLTVGMVILIACANIANMLLARSTSRAREFAVRGALGARRTQLVRQLLTECLVISMAAAVLGFAIAYGLNEALIWISQGTEEVFLMAGFDARVMAFTLLISLVAPLAFGLFPALRASSSGSVAALHDGRGGDGNRSGKRARNTLVGAQVALALTLMVVASLLTRTVITMQQRPLGFSPGGILTVELDLPDNRYEEPADRLRFYQRARDELAGVPGIGAVEFTNVIPGVGLGALRSMLIEGSEPAGDRAAPSGRFINVSHDYLEFVGLPMLRGRAFAASDNASSLRVAIVSAAVAERYWSGRDPLGERLRIAGDDDWIEVVGIVGDVRPAILDQESSPDIYVPHAQEGRTHMYLMARTDADPGALAGPIRAAIRRIDPDQPVDAIQTMERARYLNSASNYALLALFVTFAAFALFMAGIGIYGVMAYSVSQRRQEIGLRMALGAEAGSVRRMVVGQGIRIVSFGILLGMFGAFAISRLLAGIVVGVSATDPLTFIGVPMVLAAVALIANLVPAARATRLDPADTLRAG